MADRAQAIGTYQFVCADLEDGLVYSVAAQLYNESMEAIGSPKRTEASVSSRVFANDFYAEVKNAK